MGGGEKEREKKDGARERWLETGNEDKEGERGKKKRGQLPRKERGRREKVSGASRSVNVLVLQGCALLPPTPGFRMPPRLSFRVLATPSSASALILTRGELKISWFQEGSILDALKFWVPDGPQARPREAAYGPVLPTL